MSTNGNGHVNGPMRKKTRRFTEVVNILREKGAPEGFRRCRDILLAHAEEFETRMPLYNVLKLALEVDRHALFCEVAMDKTRTAHDAEAYAAYQQYLAGTTDVPVAVGLPFQAAAPAQPTDADNDEETDDGEQERP